MISAVLLNWRRPGNIQPIVSSLRSCKLIDDIVVWNNGEPLPHIEDEKCMVVDAGQNVCTYGRRLASRHCLHDTVFTQDDDVIVRNIEALYESHEQAKTYITAGLREGHYRVEAGKTPWLQLGWGSLHNRRWFDVVETYIDKYGEDELLHRKFDRIYTSLFRRHNPQIADVERLKRPDGRFWDEDKETALYKRRDHRLLTDLAVERAEELRGLLHVERV